MLTVTLLSCGSSSDGSSGEGATNKGSGIFIVSEDTFNSKTNGDKENFKFSPKDIETSDEQEVNIPDPLIILIDGKSI